MVKRHIHQVTEYFSEKGEMTTRITADIDETDYNDYDECCDCECCDDEHEGLLS